MPRDQLEKLLQKNYFLHQSAKDGFRSYLQAYASYSLKKIFDVNKLDLAKVGKAFGFAVPPRVSLALGSKSGTTAKASGKRKRDEDDDAIDLNDGEDGLEEKTSRKHKAVRHDREKEKRVLSLGQKKVRKDVYKKGGVQRGSTQWSR